MCTVRTPTIVVGGVGGRVRELHAQRTIQFASAEIILEFVSNMLSYRIAVRYVGVLIIELFDLLTVHKTRRFVYVPVLGGTKNLVRLSLLRPTVVGTRSPLIRRRRDKNKDLLLFLLRLPT